ATSRFACSADVVLRRRARRGEVAGEVAVDARRLSDDLVPADPALRRLGLDLEDLRGGGRDLVAFDDVAAVVVLVAVALYLHGVARAGRDLVVADGVVVAAQ